LHYVPAGTVEFLYDSDAEEFFFSKSYSPTSGARRTEEIHGVDLVEWMVRLGGGDFTSPLDDLRRGAALERRCQVRIM